MHAVHQKANSLKINQKKKKNLELRNKKRSSPNFLASVRLTIAEILFPRELSEGNEGNLVGRSRGRGCVVRSAVPERKLNSKLEKTFTKNLQRQGHIFKNFTLIR